MFRSSNSHRLLVVALVAMAGMVLGAPDALAGSPGSGGGSCCASPMPEGCQCCQAAKPAPQSEPVGLPAAPTRAISAPRSAAPCECTSAPAQPARDDSRRASNSRNDRSSEPIDELPLAADATAHVTSSTSPAYAFPPPSRAAIYLRIERLLL